MIFKETADFLDENAIIWVGVSDKKMLWRANLYIDERKNPDGTWKIGTGTGQANITLGTRAANCPWDDFTNAEKVLLDNLDWNGRNPWIGNAWDTRGDGKQIEIKPWTMYKNAIEPYYSIGGNVNSAVAYTFGGCDSVYDFNKDMEDQAIALGNNPEENNSALAPTLPNTENYWLNYKDTTYRPSNSYIAAKDPDREYSIYEASKSGGVDCGGFLMRVASYKINGEKAYTIGSDNDETRDLIGNAPNIAHYPGIFPSTTDYAQAKMATYSWDVVDLNLLIPGDFVWFNGHVAIINTIEYSDNHRLTDTDKITFIEATTYFKKLYVRKTITLETHIINGDVKLSYRRLIPN